MHNYGARAYPQYDLGDNLTICQDFGSDIVRYNNSCWTDDGTDYGSFNFEAFANALAAANWCYTNGLKMMLVVDMKYCFNPNSLSLVHSSGCPDRIRIADWRQEEDSTG